MASRTSPRGPSAETSANRWRFSVDFERTLKSRGFRINGNAWEGVLLILGNALLWFGLKAIDVSRVLRNECGSTAIGAGGSES